MPLVMNDSLLNDPHLLRLEREWDERMAGHPEFQIPYFVPIHIEESRAAIRRFAGMKETPVTTAVQEYEEALAKTLEARLELGCNGGDDSPHPRHWSNRGETLFAGHPSIPSKYQGDGVTMRSAWWCCGWLAALADQEKGTEFRDQETLTAESPWPPQSHPAAEFRGGYQEHARRLGR